MITKLESGRIYDPIMERLLIDLNVMKKYLK
jgi:hypothetical protein